MSRLRAILLCGVLGFSVLWQDASRSLAQSSAPQAEALPQLPAFHRLFLPESEIERRPWKHQYLPVDAADFERDLKILEDARRGAPSSDTPRLQKATYVAQLIGEDLLVGTGQFELAGGGGQPTLLPFGPCSLAIEAAQWPAKNKPAALALDAAGKLQLLVEDDKLDLRWSQRGQRTASGVVQFVLELPPSLVGTLELSLPAGAEIAVEGGGIVTPPSDPAGEPARSTSRWLIELLGAQPLSVRVVPKESAGQRRPLTLLRQATTYEFSTRGINVATQLRLDVHGEPLERLQIDLDPGLHLISAKSGDVPIPWSSATDVNSGETHVILEFQEPLAGAGRVIQLASVTPLVTGETVLLPRVLPRLVAWQEGTANLLVPAALLLERLKTTGCRQSRVTTLPAPLTGESIEIQFYEFDGRIETRVAEPRQKLSLRVGHHVEIAPDVLSTASTIELAGGFRSAKLLELPIRAGWVVDSVQSVRNTEPLSWEVEGEAPQAILRVRPGAAPQIVVQAHAPLGEQRSLEAAAVRAFDLGLFNVATELLTVQGTGGFDVRWQSEAIQGRDPQSLQSNELPLFAVAPTQMVVRVDEQLDGEKLLIERERPEFTADLHVDVVVQAQSLTETFTVSCTPAASRVDRMLIHLSQRRDEPVKWSLAGGNNTGEFSARRLSEAEQTKLGLPGGEAWELLLKLARQGPFEVRGQRRAPFTAEAPVALASVPRASSQRGKLSVRALGESGLSIRNRGLTSVPAEVLDDDHYQTARAAYHYSPSADDFATQPALTLVPGEPLQASTGAWIWSLKLVSRFSAEGMLSHQAFAHLQTAGRRHLEVELPENATLVAAWIDDAPAARFEPGAQQKPLRLELPPGKSRSRIAIHYTTPATLPALVGTITPAFPTVDVPLLHREWQLWLPPGHVIGDTDGRLPPSQAVPLSWSERLFGPLGRAAGQNMFNPLVASDWHANFASGADASLAREQAELVMATLGNLLIEYRDAEELTWGQLLAAATESLPASDVVLLVDARAIATAGIGPLTRIPAADEDSPKLGQRLLKDAGLLLVVTSERVLLTSARTAAGYDPRAAQRLADEPVAVARGTFAAQLHANPAAEGEFLPVASWLGTTDASLSESDREMQSSAEANGWRRYDIPCPGPAACEARIVHTSRMQSLAWAILLGTAGISLWRPVLRGAILVAALGILAAVALVVPASFTPIAAAAVLGVLIGTLARMTVVPPANARPREMPSVRGSQSKLVQPVVSVLMLAAIVNAGAALDAAEPPAKAPPAAGDTIYTVLFPVDDQRQPAGTKVYVPEPFYAQLLKEAAAASGRPQGWMIERAAYEATLARDMAAGLSITALKARFDLHVFQSNTPLRLPLPPETWGPAMNAARLDGRALAPDWRSGSDLVLRPLSAGRHILEIELRPAALSDGRVSGADLPIPRVAQSTLKLSGGADLDNVRVPTARGRVSLDAERSSLVAQLGATDRLAIRWPAAQGAMTASAAANLQVDELMWVRVRPGATLLDARLKFQVNSGELRTVRLSTDPRLRLLSAPAGGANIAAVRTFPGSPQTIELDLAQPVRDSVTVDLSFLVTDASGVGNLRLPRLEAIDAKPSRRWLGVSVDTALQYRIQAGEDSPSVDISKFLEAWGIGDAKPLAAFTISRGEPIWFLATQPAEPRIAAQQKNIVSVGRRAAQVRVECALDITAGVLAQMSMTAPPDLKIERISVLDQDVERVARWSAGDEGEISVFLTAPISGRQQLVLTGRWTFPATPSFDAPRFRLQAAETSRCVWEFYRQPDVLLTVNAPADVKPPELPAETPRGEFGSLAAIVHADNPDLAIGLQVADNEPHVAAVSVTSVRRDGDRFVATIDHRVEITQGVLDALRFEIPAQLVEPFRTEPSATVTVANSPATQRRVLTVRPTAPLSGRQVFRIQGRIAPAPGDRLRVPEILPLETDSLERFVLLPKQLDAQPVAWETSRLTPAKLPAEMVPRGWNPESASSHKVQADRFQAVLKSVDRDDARPIVQLADMHLTWLATGGWRMAVTYDLLPGGATDCELQLPAGSELINATVEHLPASLVGVGPGKYRLTLGPQSLPQRIEVLCAAPRPASYQLHELTPPRLADTEPLHTLCTIHHLPADRLEPLEQRLAVSASDQQLVRLNSTSRLVDLSADVLGEHLPEELARWYANWRERYWTDRLALRKSLIAAGRDPSSSEEAGEARSLDQKITALDDRLGVKNPIGQFALEHDFVQLFADSAGAGWSTQHYSLKPADGPLRIRHSIGDRSSQWRWLTASGLATLGCLLGWQMRRRELPQLPLTAIVVLVAVACWLLLGPSMWGLFALGVVAISVLWRRTNGATVRH